MAPSSPGNPNFNIPPVGVNGCVNDALNKNRAVLCDLSDGTLKCDAPSSVGPNVLAAITSTARKTGEKHS